MAYDPRTGITTYGQDDIAADPNATPDVAEAFVPSTATAFAPAPVVDPIAFWGRNNDIPYIPAEFADEFLRNLVGEEAIQQSYVVPSGVHAQQPAYAVPGLNNVSVRRYLDRRPVSAQDIMRGITSRPAFGSLQFAQTSDPDSNALSGIRNTLGQIASTPGGALWLTAVGGLLGGLAAPTVSSAAGGGMLGGLASAATTGAISSALRGGNPVTGAISGGISGGLTDFAAPIVQSVWDTFSPDIQFADLGIDDQAGMFSGGFDEFGAPGFTSPDFFEPTSLGPLMPAAMPELPADLAAMGLTETAPGVFGLLGPQGMIPSTSPSFDPAAPDITAAAEPSILDQVSRYAKLANTLANLTGGQGAPEDAPQREEGQSDADYAQSLATYVNVDAQALADAGLVPGTPEYYDYLMSQIDATINAMTGEFDFDAADLSEQLRSKTQDELTALRRALFVRGQLDQFMGSGTYTDPFTGIDEEVITGGRRVSPGVAAYHRGLGRTAAEFAEMSPGERRRAIGGFLERDPDLYGAQARADERAEQAAQAQAFLDDLKRRRGGMFGGGAGLGGISEQELAVLLQMFQQQ